MSKAKQHERIAYLREMLRQARRAVTEDDGHDLEEICNEIDGTCAQLREYAEELMEVDRDGTSNV
jgi:hypothetical protein